MEEVTGMVAHRERQEAEADRADEAQEDGTVSALKALGHPVRYRIMQLLSEENSPDWMENPCCPTDVVCVCRLLMVIDISPPALSHHLKILKKAGLVEATRAGIWVYYSARAEALAQVIASLDGLRDAAPGRRASTTSPGAELG